MKKPNKLYRKLGGKKSSAGYALAAVHRPLRSLRSMFGWDVAARDAADNFNLAPSKHSYFLVMQTLKAWGKSYRGPKLSWLFAMKSLQPKKIIDTHKPEFD